MSGLQAERTALARMRTLALLVAVLALLLREPGSGSAVAAVVAASALGALTLGAGRRKRYQQASHGLETGSHTPDVAGTLAVAVTVVVVGTVAGWEIMSW